MTGPAVLGCGDVAFGVSKENREAPGRMTAGLFGFQAPRSAAIGRTECRIGESVGEITDGA